MAVKLGALDWIGSVQCYKPGIKFFIFGDKLFVKCVVNEFQCARFAYVHLEM